jgi:RNA polymerase sigma factor FliA
MNETTVSDPADLLNRFLASRDPALREEMVLKYVALVHYVLGRLGFNQDLGRDYEDLVSQGLIGLIEAVDRFNPNLGAQFRTYAAVRIRGKVLDYLRTLDWLSRTERQRSRSVQKAISALWLKLQREPTDQEIGEYLSMDIDQVQKGLVDSSRVIVSLDTSSDSEEDEDQTLHEVIADEQQQNPSEIQAKEETLQHMVEAIQDLDQREQLVLSLYYHEKLTFKEIGHVLEITESRVCQLHARAIATLRALMKGRDEPEPLPAHPPVRKAGKYYGQGMPVKSLDRRG